MKSFQQKLNLCSFNKENKGQNILYSFSKKVKLPHQQTQFPLKKERTNFIDQVNGYIQTISSRNKSKKQHTKSKRPQVSNKTKKIQQNIKGNTKSDVQDLNKRIKNEKQVNKNLQKCIIQIQKMLWQRNERLQTLEEQLRYLQQNDRDEERIRQSQRMSGENIRKIRSSQCSLKKIKNNFIQKNTRTFKNIEHLNSEQTSRQNGTQQSQQFEDSSHIKIERSRTQSQTQMYCNYKRK